MKRHFSMRRLPNGKTDGAKHGAAMAAVVAAGFLCLAFLLSRPAKEEPQLPFRQKTWQRHFSVLKRPLGVEDVSGALTDSSTWQAGSEVQLPDFRAGSTPPAGHHGLASLAGQVVSLLPSADGGTWLAGKWSYAPGGFVLRLAQGGGLVFARFRFPADELVQHLRGLENGEWELEELPLAKAECHNFPKAPEVDPNYQAAASYADSTAPTFGPLDPLLDLTKGGSIVPLLESLPGAAGVLYLDFDGERVEDPFWNDGIVINAAPATIAGRRISTAQITEVWQMVAEDFLPFNLNVTTDEARYLAAPAGKRMRIIATPTDSWFGDAGGVAVGGSFPTTDLTENLPAWAFTYAGLSTTLLAESISHELGHTLGLSHDSLTNLQGTAVTVEYYGGHGSWGPIMGGPNKRSITQWSNCDYARGGNRDPYSDGVIREDDLAIISGASNGVGWRNDVVPDSLPGLMLEEKGTINQKGILGERKTASQPDVDVFTFQTAGGPWAVTASPAEKRPNLDVGIELLNDAGVVLASASPATSLSASLSGTLTPGRYHLRLTGTGNGNPAGPGYSAYASMGAYSLKGSYVPQDLNLPVITQEPAGATVSPGLPVAFRVDATSAGNLSYQWLKDGVPITGATKNLYSLPKTVVTQQGSYQCRVSNGAGSVLSQPAILRLYGLPAVLLQPTPSAFTLSAGQPLRLEAAAEGVGLLRYQWQWNSQNIAGETGPTLLRANAVFADSGSYRVLISNNYGSVTSKTAVVTVQAPVVITRQPPGSLGLPLAGAGSLSVAATGTGKLTYQWWKNGQIVPKATSPVLSLKPVTQATAGSYTCWVQNTVNTTVHRLESTACIVTVGSGLRIVTQPLAALAVPLDGTISLSTTATAAGPVSFQWQKNGIDLPGQNNSSLSVSPASWKDAGNYTCLVASEFDRQLTRIAKVVVAAAPRITADPVTQTLAKQSKVTLRVAATGTPPLLYQWRKNGIAIPKALAATFALVATESASYDCVVSNTLAGPARAAISAAAAITVLDRPVITPLPATLFRSKNSSLSLAAAVTGSPNMQFLWQKDGVTLPSQTTATLTLDALKVEDSGSYRLQVMNPVGNPYSTTMKLAVLEPIVIRNQPNPAVADLGGSVVFFVHASGGGTLRYQWYHNGIALPKAVSSLLSIAKTTAASAGNYHVVVSNAAESLVSNSVPLTMRPAGVAEILGFTPKLSEPGHLVEVDGLKFTTGMRIELVASNGTAYPVSHSLLSPSKCRFILPSVAHGSYTLRIATQGVYSTHPTSLRIASGANDHFNNARLVTDADGDYPSHITPALTAEADEPTHAYVPAEPNPMLEAAHSLWFRMTPAVAGRYEISIADANFNGRMGCYIGNQMENLQLVGFAFTDPPATISVAAGSTIRIAVDGFDFSEPTTGERYLDVGDFTLRIRRLGPLE